MVFSALSLSLTVSVSLSPTKRASRFFQGRCKEQEVPCAVGRRAGWQRPHFPKDETG